MKCSIWPQRSNKTLEAKVLFLKKLHISPKNLQAKFGKDLMSGFRAMSYVLYVINFIVPSKITQPSWLLKFFSSFIINGGHKKEDVGLAYVIEKYGIGGVLFMII